MTHWEIEGRELINCSCSYGCPCQFSAPPNNGKCEARMDLPYGFEYELAEIGSASSRASGKLPLTLKDSYAQFARLHLGDRGVVRHWAAA